jgi:hypothetical protein
MISKNVVSSMSNAFIDYYFVLQRYYLRRCLWLLGFLSSVKRKSSYWSRFLIKMELSSNSFPISTRN